METGTIISFTWEGLWFLRPQWLWGFIAVAAIGTMFIFSHRREAQWKRSFSATLLRYLLVPGTRRQSLWPRVILILLLSLMILALSGPTWEEREHPGERSEAAMVILLDLSKSMEAEDIQPKRIDRARMKIRDLFDAQPNIRTALVAFAGSAHTVVPFTKDYRAIERQMEALNMNIMPLQGTNLPEAFALADSLLGRVEAPSFILLVTDRIAAGEEDLIRQSAGNNRVEVMIIATPGGAAIPEGRGVVRDASGEPVIAGFDPAVLEVLGRVPGIDIITVTLDDTDVKILAMNIRRNLEFTETPEQAETDWKDAGYWLLAPMLLLTLFWFRKGWLVQWCWILLLMSSCSADREGSLEGLFRTRDQQGQRLYQKGEWENAGSRFESAAWKGMAYAEAGDLDKAVDAFSRETNAAGFYNLGVVYVKMGDAEAARDAFQAALELDPELQPAEKNLQVVNHVLDSIHMVLAENGEHPEDTHQPEKFQETQESPDEKEKAEQSDETYKGKGDVTEMGTREVDEESVDFFDTGNQPVPFDQEGTPQALIRQMEENPSVFLRRKFAHQLRKRKPSETTDEEDW